MNSGTHASVMGNRKNRAVVETVAQIVFTICAFFAVLAVVSITLYMIISGTPAIMKVGLGEILFGTEWMPTAADPKFGILWVILTSIVGTTLAILLGVPIGVLTAIPGRGGTQTLSCHCKACGRAVSWHPFRYLRTVRNLLTESSHV